MTNKNNKLVMIIINLLFITEITYGNDFSLKIGYNGYGESGLVKTIYPTVTERPEWTESSIGQAFIPDVLETQVFLSENYALQFDIGMIQPNWMLRNNTSFRIGVKRKLNLAVISRATLGYSQFLKIKNGKTIDIRITGNRVDYSKWLKIEPMVHAGVRIDKRDNAGTMQVFDYFRFPVNILLGEKETIDLTLGTILVFKAGSGGKDLFGAVPDFYLSINFRS